jgi:hypothetical protein
MEANKGSNTTLKEHGRGSDYLTRRIARDRPDILERMKAGDFTSVRKAAIEVTRCYLRFLAVTACYT